MDITLDKKIIVNGLVYKLNEETNEAYIIDQESSSESYFIPRSIINDSKEYIVKKICKYSFSSFYLSYIEFDENSELQTIEKYVFSNSQLNSLKIPSSVTELEEGWCRWINHLYYISVDPNNPRYSTYENQYLISKSTPDKEYYDVLEFAVRNIKIAKIPDFIEIIKPYSFSKCTQLQKIEVSDNSKLRIIKDDAFCFSSLKSITIPPNFESFNDGWCSFTYDLININISSKNQYYKMYEDKMIIGKSSSSFEQQNYDLLIFCHRNVESITIPNFIEIIKPYAFDNCKKLKQIKIQPDSKLKIICENAFYITGINEITIPPSLEKICNYSFSMCTNLQQINIPKNSHLQIIEERAFQFTLIKSLLIPSNVVELKDGWCSSIDNLIHIEIMPNNKIFTLFDDKFILGKSSPNIENYDVLVFAMRNIETAIIPSFIEIIGSSAFHSCILLQKVKFSENSKLRKIGSYAFSRSSIKKIVIPDNVTQIEERAFFNCTYLKEIDFSKDSKIEKISKNTFSDSSIINFSLPKQIKLIDEGAFQYCKLIKKIDIPIDSNLQIIEKYAFDCSPIEKFFMPINVIQICECSFFSCKMLKYVIIPKDSKLQRIEASAFKSSSITSIFIPSHVTHIFNEAFDECKYFQIIEFDENSELQYIFYSSFGYFSGVKIMVPVGFDLPNIIK